MVRVTAINQAQVGSLQVIAGALLWAAYGLFVKSVDFPPAIILFFRYFAAMLGLLVFSATRDRLNWIKPSFTHWKWVIFPALFTGLSWFTYTIALQQTYVANAAFLAYTAPVFTVLFAPLIIKEKLELKSIAALVMALLGTLAIMGYNSLFYAGASLTGDFYALTAGLIGGLIISFVKKIPAAMSSYQVNIVMSGFISLFLMPLLLLSGVSISWQGLLLMMAMGLVSQALGTTLFYTGLRTMKAQHSAVLTYADPLAATILASLFLAEQITFGSVIGGALIIASGIIIVFQNRVNPALEQVKL